MSRIKSPVAATIIAGSLAMMTPIASNASVTAVTAKAITDQHAVVVSLDDLDLATPRAQETLFYRLSRAAKQVCGSRDPRLAGGVAQAARNGECYDAALSEALAKAGQDAVASTRR